MRLRAPLLECIQPPPTIDILRAVEKMISYRVFPHEVGIGATGTLFFDLPSDRLAKFHF